MARASVAALALFVVLAGLAVAGCGRGAGSAEADARYAEAVNAAQADFRRRFDALSRGAGATSTPGQDRRMLTRFSDAVGVALGRLSAARPPARVAALHRRLVEQVASYQREIDAAREALATRDARRVLAARGRFTADVAATGARVNRTVDEINAALRG
jgi:hypothetical protein